MAAMCDANMKERDLRLADYIIQPGSFWTRESWLKTGTLDESLHFGFDWDWFIRAMKAGVVFKTEDRYLSAYRIHGAHKTGVGGDKPSYRVGFNLRAACWLKL